MATKKKLSKWIRGKATKQSDKKWLQEMGKAYFYKGFPYLPDWKKAVYNGNVRRDKEGRFHMLLPRIGQTIRLTFAGSSEDTSLQTFKSRVVDMKDEIASIELPTSEETGRTGLFGAGAACEVWYVGEDGSRYEFHSSITGRRSEPIPVLFLQLPPKEEILRTQRRNYLRIDTALDIAVKLEDPIRNYHFVARTVDISGGGLSFTCDESFRIQDHDSLKVWISMPSKTGQVQHAYAVVEVVRQKPAEKKGLHQWISGKFTEISEQDRVKVVRACYERQLELRKKGVVE